MSEWDSEDFVPAAPSKKISDKWDGEDEEPTKEAWDDEEEERVNQAVVPEKKKKKKLADIIAEKEKRKMEEMLRRKKEREEELKSMTPQGILEEKLRIKKVQEDSDLALMCDLVGEDEEEEFALDEYDLTDKDGLESFRKALVNKIRDTDQLEKELHFVTFVEELCRDLCKNMECDDIKRVTVILNTLCNEKVKASKATSKSKKKAAGTAKLNLGKGAVADSCAFDDYGEYDDFI